MDRFEISTLRAYYGALITEKQNEFLRLHYDEDISLGELAEKSLDSGDTDSCRDSISKARNLLEE